jgi:histidinol phosphatase-like PHP family hydrolase
VRHGVAIEINGKSRVPEPDAVRRFAARGVTFSFGSDGHTPEGVGDLAYPQEIWADLGLPADRLLPAPRA